jgi:hypothetical protein
VANRVRAGATYALAPAPRRWNVVSSIPITGRVCCSDT